MANVFSKNWVVVVSVILIGLATFGFLMPSVFWLVFWLMVSHKEFWVLITAIVFLALLMSTGTKGLGLKLAGNLLRCLVVLLVVMTLYWFAENQTKISQSTSIPSQQIIKSGNESFIRPDLTKPVVSKPSANENKEVRVKVEKFFAEYSELVELISQETQFNQKGTDGTVLKTGPKGTYLCAARIDPRWEGLEPDKYKLETLEGCLGQTLALYKAKGLEPWLSRSGKELRFTRIVENQWSVPIYVMGRRSTPCVSDEVAYMRINEKGKYNTLRGKPQVVSVEGDILKIDLQTTLDHEVKVSCSFAANQN